MDDYLTPDELARTDALIAAGASAYEAVITVEREAGRL